MSILCQRGVDSEMHAKRFLPPSMVRMEFGTAWIVSFSCPQPRFSVLHSATDLRNKGFCGRHEPKMCPKAMQYNLIIHVLILWQKVTFGLGPL